MRLKEITPGMVIHCKNYDEKKALLEEAERLGYIWYFTKKKPTDHINNTGNTIHFYASGTKPLLADYKHITHSWNVDDAATEFSDLILPDLTAEEVLNTIKEICASNNTCNDMCLLCDGKGCVIRKTEFDVKNVIEICSQWKADHEKQKLEIETVNICRIIEVLPDGRKRCVHEEDLASGSTDAEIKILVEAELKQYVSKHDGEFIAVHEVVSRVKK